MSDECLSVKEQTNPLFFHHDPKRKCIVTSYWYPDTDGLASSVAAVELLARVRGIPATSVISMEPQLETAWLMNRYGISLPQISEKEREAQVVLVDVSDPADLPPEISENPHNVVGVIDHRPYGALSFFPRALTQVETVGAAATLVAEQFLKRNLKPTPLTRDLLYAAVASNTVRFKGKGYTERDRVIAEWLKTGDGAHLEELIEAMFRAKSDFSKHSMYEVIERDVSSKLFPIFEVPTVVAQLEVVDPMSLFEKRLNEIYEALTTLRDNRDAAQIFMSVVDTSADRDATYLVSPSPEIQERLNESFGAQTVEGTGIGVLPITITRKEIIGALLT